MSMELDFAVLAEAATTSSDGKMSMLGCGYDIFVSETVPFEVRRISLAMRFLIHPAEVGVRHRFEVRLIDGDAHPIIPTHIGLLEAPAGRLSGVIVPYPLVMEFANVAFARHGPYSFEIYIGEHLVKSVPIYVVAQL